MRAGDYVETYDRLEKRYVGVGIIKHIDSNGDIYVKWLDDPYAKEHKGLERFQEYSLRQIPEKQAMAMLI